MSKINCEGGVTISGRDHAIEYELDSMTGGATLFLRVKGINHNYIPIHYNRIDEVIEMLKKGKGLISILEKDD
jgi:hypothetical protein